MILTTQTIRVASKHSIQVVNALFKWNMQKRKNTPVENQNNGSPYTLLSSVIKGKGILYSLCYDRAPKDFTQTDEPNTLQEGRQLAQKLNADFYPGFPTEQFPDTLPQNIKSNPRSQYVTKPIFSLYFEYT
jgi:hypothetical protein